ncbi:MAG TPA: LEA type 2 family protein [Turneriella sp.]|nr:LEA type 2 family protein [Turneriella sp.]
MLSKKRLTQAAFVVFLFWALGCASLVKKIFDPPQVGLDRVEIQNVDFTGADLLLYIKINNPNSIGATIKSIDYAFDIDGERLVKGTKNEKTEIAANDLSIIQVPVSLRYAGLKSGVLGALSKKSLPYVLSGTVVLDTPVGALSFDIGNKGDIPVPDRPRFEIEKIALSEFSVTSTTLMVHIRVTNNHDIALDIEKFRYEFSLQDKLISATDVQVSRSIDTNKSMAVVLPITVKLLGLKQSIVDMIRSGQIKYAMKFDLNLNTRFGPFTIPYERDGLTALY